MTARSNSPEEPLTSDDQPLHSEVYLVIEDNVVKTCVKNAIVPDVNFVTFFTNMWQKHEDKVALLLIVTTGTCDEALSLSELKRSHPEQIAAPLNLNADSVLAILYSSGSTGLPKGVQLNHRNLISQVISHGYLDPSVFESSDVYIAVAPIMHVGGFWLIFSYLGQGCKVIAVHTTDFDVVLPAIERHRPDLEVFSSAKPEHSVRLDSPVMPKFHVDRTLIGGKVCL
ncbi:hypothetical protein V5799_002186 [Amblyomma americanum]|uniref:AMP-dependent synthetase/ligase domain-containing protein n=1 Tax=Amblyomma americanum TaxID=6943 RepID=A0AAQ4CY22_AMBAM